MIQNFKHYCPQESEIEQSDRPGSQEGGRHVETGRGRPETEPRRHTVT